MSIFSRRKKFRNLISSAISAVVLSSCASQVAQGWFFHCFEFAPDLGAIHVKVGLPEFVDFEGDEYDVNLGKFSDMKFDFCMGCYIRNHDIWLVMDGTSNVRIVYDDEFRKKNKDKKIKCYPCAGSWKSYFNEYDNMKQIIHKYILRCHSFLSYVKYNKPKYMRDLICEGDGLSKLIASSDKEYVKLNEELNR